MNYALLEWSKTSFWHNVYLNVIITAFYFQCLPNEKEEIEREHNLSRQGSLIKVPRDFTDSKHLIENEYKDHGYKDSAEYQDNNEYRDANHYHLGQEKTPPPTETDFWEAAAIFCNPELLVPF